MAKKPETHMIILMKGTMLMCSCGQELKLAGTDMNLSQRLQWDQLLDAHARHKTRMEAREE